MKELLISNSINVIGESINGLVRYGETREYQKTERHRISSLMKENIERLHSRRDVLKEIIASQHQSNMAVIDNVGVCLMEATMQNNIELASQYCQVLLGIVQQGQGINLATNFLQSPNAAPSFNRLT